jgi:hypothetical protein
MSLSTIMRCLSDGAGRGDWAAAGIARATSGAAIANVADNFRIPASLCSSRALLARYAKLDGSATRTSWMSKRLNAVPCKLDGDSAKPWLSAFVLVAILGGFVSAIATTLLWWMTSLPGWVGQFSPEGMVYGGLLLFALFSADAWRRWG